ncbi:hypothetical protein BVX97_06485 [bacterium E08(2017)]|nr:hypothetical protein BVX97_06485 [bacterium E08(2017)]
MMNDRKLLVVVSVVLLALSLEGAELHGFVDVRGGARLQEDTTQDDVSLAELRVQMETEAASDFADFTLRMDVIYDDVMDDRDIDLEEGMGWLDLREASLLVPFDTMDMKMGRQILTWGTGDLLFINDMFPKDWQAFFIGRDEEYLKAPSDAVFVSLFPSFMNIDIAYTPRFDSDRYIRGERISYWNPMLGAVAGQDAVIEPTVPDDWFDDHEIALRISRNIGGYETALYGYYGFWKNPEGMDAETMIPYFPELSVYGASVRGPAGNGLLNLEAGYYDSREEDDGTNPMVPNDEIRGLIGYEQEIVKNLSCGLQYYIEHIQDFDGYEAGLQEGQVGSNEDRHLVTLRLTKQAMSQNLVLSLFVYYSPSDEDFYARPAASYKASDNLLLTAGGNIFGGSESHTFFGQFEDNSNLYAGVRYSY